MKNFTNHHPYAKINNEFRGKNKMNELEKMILEARLGHKPSKMESIKNSISLFAASFQKKLKYTGAILTGKLLPYSKEYVGAPSVSQSVVEEHPEKWIIEECIPACQILWDKNIYTFMCSDQLDQNAWIEIRLATLSDENKQVLETIKKQYNCYQYHTGCINISVPGKGIRARQELIKIANMFAMQDVLDPTAFTTLEEILISSGCSKQIPNPAYKPLEEQLKDLTFANWGMSMEEEYITVVDETKITRPVLDYITSFGAIWEDDKIYRSEFDYNKHLKYLEYLNKTSMLKK